MKKIKLIRILIVLISLSIISPMVFAIRGDNYFYKALDAQKKGLLYKAIKYYELSLKKNHRHIKSHLNLATAYFQVNEIWKTHLVMDEILEIYPFSLEANYNMGMIYSKERELVKAAKYFEIVLKLRPSNFDSYYQLSRIYTQLDFFKMAQDKYNEMLSFRPFDISIRLEYARFLVIFKKYDVAEQEFWKLLELSKKDFAINYEYALLLDKIGTRTENAITQYKNVILLDENHIQARYNLGLNYEQMKLWEEAKRQYLTIAEKTSKFHRAYVRLGVIFRRENKDKIAFKFLNKAIYLNPKIILPYEEKAIIYIKQEKYDLAARQYRFLTSYHPNYVKAYIFKGWLFEHLNDPRSAEREYKLGLKINKLSLEAQHTLASFYYKFGRITEARRLYNDILHQDRKNDLAQYKIGIIYIDENKIAKAQSIFLKIAKKSQYYISAQNILKKLKETKRLPASE